MDLKLNPYQTAAVAGSASSAGGAAAAMADSAGSAFSGSLANALDAMTTSVQEVRTQLSSGQLLTDKTALQNTFSSLSALLGQFNQVLQSASAASAPSVLGAVSGVGTALSGVSSRAVAAPVPASVTDMLEAAFSRQVPLSTAAPTGGAANAVSGAVAASPAAFVGVQGLGAASAVASPAQTYLAHLQSSNPTEKWVVAALNKSIAQAQANGYDPEKSYSVNTLRGYFSGDAQARSNAIHSLDSAMLAAGGAYETFDYGVHAIVGALPEGMDTTMPTFQTAFDKDWNRPSLYDMINSSLGWPGDVPGSNGRQVNFADPSNRDGVLNRKLSDAEVAAFQSGQLTPELQILVHRYRSATA